MQLAAINAMYDDLHAGRPFHDGTFAHWSEKRGESHPFHYREGVTVWLSRENLTPDDDFLEQGLVAHESDHEDDRAADSE